MKNPARFHQSVLVPIIFTTTFLLSQSGQAALNCEVAANGADLIATVSHEAAVEAQQDLSNPAFAAGHNLRIDAEDIEKIKERKTVLQKIAETFGWSKTSQLDLNDPASRVEFVARGSEFRTWFATADSIAHDLAERDEDMPVLTKPVADPKEGLLAKLMMVRNAQHSIDLSYYIYESDPAGLSLFKELKDAVARGVKVRLMVDSLGSLTASMKGNAPAKALLDYAKKNAGYLRDENGQPTKIKASAEFVVFNPMTGFEAIPRDLVRKTANVFIRLLNRATGRDLPTFALTEWSMDRRSHDKFLVVDALYPKLAIGMFGGRNIADRYFHTDPTITDNFVDYEEIVRNDPSLVDTMAADQNIGHAINTLFERLYFHTANREVTRGLIGRIFGKGQVAKMDLATQTIAKNTDDVLKKLGEDLTSPTFGQKYLSTGFIEGDAALVTTIANIERQHVAARLGVSDYMQGIRSGDSLIDDLSQILKNSGDTEAATGQAEELTLISPYIWLSGRDASLLKKWLLFNPKRKLTIITNSIMTTDNLPAQVLVDTTLAQSLVYDQGLRNARGDVIRRSVSDQVTVFAYGRADSTDLGGKTIYPKLHEKGFVLKQANYNAVLTYNQDPRSRYLNSESGLVIKSPGSVAARLAHFEVLKSQSTIFGTDEWKAIRAKMKGAKKEIVQHTGFFFEALRDLNIWWAI